MRRQASLKRRGFTLIELLVVIGVILILASITFGISAGVRNAQARTRAKADMAALSQGLEQFKSRYGDYPWIDDDKGAYPGGSEAEQRNSMMLYALTGRAKIRRDGDGNVEMVKVADDMEDEAVEDNPKFIDPTKFEVRDGVIVDPWGVPYEYLYRREANHPDWEWELFGFRLFSKGPDGEASDGKLNDSTGIAEDGYRDASENVDNIYANE